MSERIDREAAKMADWPPAHNRRQRAGASSTSTGPQEFASADDGGPNLTPAERRDRRRQLPSLDRAPQPVAKEEEQDVPGDSGAGVSLRGAASSLRDVRRASRLSHRAVPPIPTAAGASSAADGAAESDTETPRLAPEGSGSLVFYAGEDSLAVACTALREIAPEEDDVAPGAPSTLLPPIEHHRMAPPLGYADHVYRQKVKGSFERVDGFGTASVGSATSVSGGSLRSGNALSNTLDRSGNAISNTLNSIRGGHARGTSMEQPRQSEPYGVWQPYGGRPSYPPNSYQPPMAPELQLASALFHIAVAPTRFAAGVLVGLATMEAGLLVYIGYSLRPTPLTPLYLYAAAALDFYRLKLWLSLGAFVGFTCSHLARSRGNHYFLQPSQYYVDKALQLVYFAMVWITFAGRSTPWVLATPQQADLRALHPSVGIPGQSTPFDLLKATWMEFVPYLIAFEVRLIACPVMASECHSAPFIGFASLRFASAQILSVVGAVLAFVPTLDEYFEPPPDSTKEAPPRSLALVVSGTGSRATVPQAESSMGAEVAERAAAGGYLFGDGSVIDLQEHLLGLGSSVEGGLSLAVGSWSYRMQMKMARPAPRAPDGTPARQPLPLHAFHRQKYAGRVCTAMCVLVLDAICNLYNDTVILDGVRAPLPLLISSLLLFSLSHGAARPSLFEPSLLAAGLGSLSFPRARGGAWAPAPHLLHPLRDHGHRNAALHARAVHCRPKGLRRCHVMGGRELCGHRDCARAASHPLGPGQHEGRRQAQLPHDLDWRSVRLLLRASHSTGQPLLHQSDHGLAPPRQLRVLSAPRRCALQSPVVPKRGSRHSGGNPESRISRAGHASEVLASVRRIHQLSRGVLDRTRVCNDNSSAVAAARSCQC